MRSEQHQIACDLLGAGLRNQLGPERFDLFFVFFGSPDKRAAILREAAIKHSPAVDVRRSEGPRRRASSPRRMAAGHRARCGNQLVNATVQHGCTSPEGGLAHGHHHRHHR